MSVGAIAPTDYPSGYDEQWVRDIIDIIPDSWCLAENIHCSYCRGGGVGTWYPTGAPAPTSHPVWGGRR